jgi:hypothetical protein
MPAGLLTLPLKVDAWLGSRWNAVRGRFLHSVRLLLPSLVGAPGGAAWVPFQACGPAYKRGFFVPLASIIAKLPELLWKV